MIEVGKKYRVVGNKHCHDFNIGEVVIAIEEERDEDHYYKMDNGKDFWWMTEEELEPFTIDTTKIRLTNNAPVPFYATAGAAGFDIAANETVTINPGHWVPVATGLHIQLPVEQELQIRSRSGIAKKDGLIVHQGIGTIDSDYRGEIFVMLRNTGLNARTVNRGDRIAQGVIAPVIRVEFEVVDKLDDTVRGDAGFGSSGR